jgi:glutaredoxin 3
VVLYTTQFCPFCIRAKQLLASKNVKYQEIDINKRPEERAVMVKKSGGGTTVPQIFIDDEAIGGCDEMFALERAGHLDAMLSLL